MNTQTKINQKNLSDIIIKYLSDKKDHQDNLEGITLFVYENEVKELSGQVMNAIGDLLSKGLLKELENSDGRKSYQLLNLHSL